MLTDAELAELERLLAAVTDKPWAALPGSALMVQGDPYGGEAVAEFERPGDHSDPLKWPVASEMTWQRWKNRLLLTVAARAALPSLIAELRAARARIRELERKLTAENDWLADGFEMFHGAVATGGKTEGEP